MMYEMWKMWEMCFYFLHIWPIRHIIATHHLFYIRRDATPVDRGASRHELVVRSQLNGALAFVMNQERALLGLLGRVATDIDEGPNDVVKRIDLVIVNDELPWVFGRVE